MAFQYLPETLDDYTEYVVQQLKAGRGVEISYDPRDGSFTGIAGIDAGTPMARYVAERGAPRVHAEPLTD